MKMTLQKMLAGAALALGLGGCGHTLPQTDLQDREALIDSITRQMAPTDKSTQKYCSKDLKKKSKIAYCNGQKALSQNLRDMARELRDKLEDKLLSVSRPEFREYEDVIRRARDLSDIRFFHRYSKRLLEESNRNLIDPNYKADKPLAVFFMGLYETKTFGVRALDVKVDEIEKFVEGYKVIVFESSSFYQMHLQMKKVEKLYEGKNKISGLMIGGHGTKDSITLGQRSSDGDQMLYGNSVNSIFRNFESMFSEDAIVFLASCNNGEGREEELNIANTFAYTLPGRKVFSCTKVLVDFDYELDENNQIDPDSIKMTGLEGLIPKDCTYVAQCDDGKEKCLMKYTAKLLGKNLSEIMEFKRLGLKRFRDLMDFRNIEADYVKQLLDNGANLKEIKKISYKLDTEKNRTIVLEATRLGVTSSSDLSTLIIRGENLGKIKKEVDQDVERYFSVTDQSREGNDWVRDVMRIRYKMTRYDKRNSNNLKKKEEKLLSNVDKAARADKFDAVKYHNELDKLVEFRTKKSNFWIIDREWELQGYDKKPSTYQLIKDRFSKKMARNSIDPFIQRVSAYAAQPDVDKGGIAGFLEHGIPVKAAKVGGQLGIDGKNWVLYHSLKYAESLTDKKFEEMSKQDLKTFLGGRWKEDALRKAAPGLYDGRRVPLLKND